MSTTTTQNNGQILNVKRTKGSVLKNLDLDQKERENYEFVFDAENTKALALYLSGLAEGNKQSKLIFRVSEQTSNAGHKFPSAFAIVKEMVPKTEQAGTKTYQPVKADADAIRSSVN